MSKIKTFFFFEKVYLGKIHFFANVVHDRRGGDQFVLFRRGTGTSFTAESRGSVAQSVAHASLQMSTSARTGQIGIINRSRNANCSSTTRKAMAEVVRHHLHLIGGEAVVVVQNVITSGATGALNSRVRAKIKNEFVGVNDRFVDNASGINILRFTATVVSLFGKQPSVVTFLNNDERNLRSVFCVDFKARFTNAAQLFAQNLLKLAFRNAVAVNNDSFGLLLSRFIKRHQTFRNFIGDIYQMFVPLLLNFNRSRVTHLRQIH